MKTSRCKPYVRQFYQGNHWNLSLAVAGTLLAAACDLLFSWLLQQIVDASTGSNPLFSLPQLAMIALGSLVLLLITWRLEYVSRPRFLARALEQFRNFVFGRLSHKSISAFSGESTSLYISALSNDANTIETDYLADLFSLIRHLVIFAGALALMLYYSPWLTLVAVLLSVFPLAAALLTGNRAAVAEQTVSAQNESFVDMLKDSLTGFSLIKAFKAETAIGKLFAQRVKELANAKANRRRLAIVIQFWAQFSYCVTQFGVFLAGAWMALSSQSITPGVLIVFVQLMNYVIQPIGAVPQILASRKAAYALIGKLADALETNVRSEGKAITPELTKEILVRDLSFSYDGERKALDHFSYCFEAGKSYAIVGASGSGKSTLLQMMMAGYSHYDGEILYDGANVKSISSESLYDLVTLVQQNVFVFNSTIRANITMFHDFPAAEVDRVIHLSGLDALIAQRGADAPCGENGCLLSGGEKQRIAIARSLLLHTPVILVDEATSSLDAQTAWHVSGSILGLDSLTRIVVTHSLEENLLRQYDSILAMKNGKLTESGSFEELMNAKGYFYSLYTLAQES